jgi:hypothetical protein
LVKEKAAFWSALDCAIALRCQDRAVLAYVADVVSRPQPDEQGAMVEIHGFVALNMP